MRKENMVLSPAGIGTKNDCAGEDQQQFTLQTDREGDGTEYMYP
jgi:hypothetical protein